MFGQRTFLSERFLVLLPGFACHFFPALPGCGLCTQQTMQTNHKPCKPVGGSFPLCNISIFRSRFVAICGASNAVSMCKVWRALLASANLDGSCTRTSASRGASDPKHCRHGKTLSDRCVRCMSFFCGNGCAFSAQSSPIAQRHPNRSFRFFIPRYGLDQDMGCRARTTCSSHAFLLWSRDHPLALDVAARLKGLSFEGKGYPTIELRAEITIVRGRTV